MPTLIKNPSAARTALGHELKAIAARLKSEDRDPTTDERQRMGRLEQLIRTEDDNDLSKGIRDWAVEQGLEGPDGQHADRRKGRGWGERVVKACSDNLGRFKDLAPSGGAPVTIPVNPDPVRLGEPVTALRQLMANVANTTGAFAYLRQTVRENNAAAVAAGALKPTSRYGTERVDDTVKVIAHLSEPIDRSTLSDAPLLEQFVHDELELGLEYEIERLVIDGTGTGGQFRGISNTSGIQTVGYTTDLLTTTRAAVTGLETINRPGDGWLLSPQDWAAIEMSIAPGAGYAYTAAGGALPIERAARRLWGLPVAVSAAAAPGTGYLARWQDIALHVREEARIDWSEAMWRPDAFGSGQGASDFSRNLIAFRCEARMGLAVHRPAGVVEIDLTP